MSVIGGQENLCQAEVESPLAVGGNFRVRSLRFSNSYFHGCLNFLLEWRLLWRFADIALSHVALASIMLKLRSASSPSIWLQPHVTYRTTTLGLHCKYSTLHLSGKPRPCQFSEKLRLKCTSKVWMTIQQASTTSKVAVTPLELEDAEQPPLNLYKPKEPYTATIVSVENLFGPKAQGETCHIVIDHGGNVPYWEGQSYGVIPPGENSKKPGMPHTVRLYSIASSRYGDSFDGKTTSLCVRRAVYYDPETGKEDPSKNGICSNYLCDCKPGDKVQITGPSGKVMLLPEDDPNATHIMIATGTGIAPYRGYLRRMFKEDIPSFKFQGLAWLFLGVANTDSLLYHDEFSEYLKKYPDNFRYDTALSRQHKNKLGGKMYVQDKIEEYSDEIFWHLDKGAHIYFCGLKGMMPGIQDTLKRVAEDRGENWAEKLLHLKKNKQWHVEVY